MQECGMNGLDDQLDAASAETRRLLARVGIGDATAGPAENFWAEALIDQMMARGTTACIHVKRRPTQPIFATAWERIWRCRRCEERHSRRGVEQLRAGSYHGLGFVEEHTCDRCRRYASELMPLVVRTGFMVLYAAICPRCARDAERAGGKEIAS
jgi:hypothetical protein